MSQTNKVSAAHIKSLCDTLTAKFHVFEDTTTTICALFLPNGFMVATGSSACVDAANFDEKLGMDIAYGDAMQAAINKLWELEGYRLKLELEKCSS